MNVVFGEFIIDAKVGIWLLQERGVRQNVHGGQRLQEVKRNECGEGEGEED